MLFYSCFTVNNTAMQYTHNILFNAHCHVVDLIHTVGVNQSLLKGINNQHIMYSFSIVAMR